MGFYKNIEDARVAFNKKDDKDILMEKRFLELMNQGLTLKIDSEKNGIKYYDKNNNWVITICFESKIIWFNYYDFWSKFESEFSLNHQQVMNFLNDKIDRYLNCKGFITVNLIMNN